MRSSTESVMRLRESAMRRNPHPRATTHKNPSPPTTHTFTPPPTPTTDLDVPLIGKVQANGVHKSAALVVACSSKVGGSSALPARRPDTQYGDEQQAAGAWPNTHGHLHRPSLRSPLMESRCSTVGAGQRPASGALLSGGGRPAGWVSSTMAAAAAYTPESAWGPLAIAAAANTAGLHRPGPVGLTRVADDQQAPVQRLMHWHKDEILCKQVHVLSEGAGGGG